MPGGCNEGRGVPGRWGVECQAAVGLGLWGAMEMESGVQGCRGSGLWGAMEVGFGVPVCRGAGLWGPLGRGSGVPWDWVIPVPVSSRDCCAHTPCHNVPAVTGVLGGLAVLRPPATADSAGHVPQN